MHAETYASAKTYDNSKGGVLAARAPSPFERVSIANDYLEKLEGRLTDIASRLVGSGPSPDSGVVGPRSVPSGALGELDETARIMVGRIERMNDQLGRISDQLP